MARWIDRDDILRRLGIEQLPRLIASDDAVDCEFEAPSDCEPVSMMTVGAPLSLPTYAIAVQAPPRLSR
jgi:hypothetical protein